MKFLEYLVTLVLGSAFGSSLGILIGLYASFIFIDQRNQDAFLFLATNTVIVLAGIMLVFLAWSFRDRLLPPHAD